MEKKFQPLIDAMENNITGAAATAIKAHYAGTWDRVSAAKVDSSYWPLTPTYLSLCKDVKIHPFEAYTQTDRTP